MNMPAMRQTSRAYAAIFSLNGWVRSTASIATQAWSTTAMLIAPTPIRRSEEKDAEGRRGEPGDDEEIDRAELISGLYAPRPETIESARAPSAAPSARPSTGHGRSFAACGRPTRRPGKSRTSPCAHRRARRPLRPRASRDAGASSAPPAGTASSSPARAADAPPPRRPSPPARTRTGNRPSGPACSRIYTEDTATLFPIAECRLTNDDEGRRTIDATIS